MPPCKLCEGYVVPQLVRGRLGWQHVPHVLPCAGKVAVDDCKVEAAARLAEFLTAGNTLVVSRTCPSCEQTKDERLCLDESCQLLRAGGWIQVWKAGQKVFETAFEDFSAARILTVWLRGYSLIHLDAWGGLCAKCARSRKHEVDWAAARPHVDAWLASRFLEVPREWTRAAHFFVSASNVVDCRLVYDPVTRLAWFRCEACSKRHGTFVPP